MILVDTSVWIDHLRAADPFLNRLLDEDLVLVHPWVRGELALGCLARRVEFLELLSCLPAAEVVPGGELLALIESRGLAGRGIGWVDLQLLGSALTRPCRLLTHDRRLGEIALEFGIAAVEKRSGRS